MQLPEYKLQIMLSLEARFLLHADPAFHTTCQNPEILKLTNSY